MTNAEHDAVQLRKMAQEQLAQAAGHQVLGRTKRIQFHRSRADLFRRAADALDGAIYRRAAETR